MRKNTRAPSAPIGRRPIVAGTVAALAAAAACLSAPPFGAAAARRTASPSARVAAVRPCTASQTRVWLGNGPGGGAAGTVYYPLEFSNVGHARCTLSGYPGVSGYGSAGRQVGRPATRSAEAHGTVTLAPGATAHALLGIRDWGAICSRRARAQGLKVYAPGQRRATSIGFRFGACAAASVLIVKPVRAGVGIPGHTTS